MVLESKRILFIDDLEENALVAKESLEHLGYQVTAVTDSIKAFDIFSNSPDDFDLIITDQAMPGMMGDALVKAVREIKPDIPVILVTGYSTKVTKTNYREFGFNDFIMKPWMVRDMNSSIMQVIGRL